MKGWREFNLNRYAKVKLTENGLMELERQHNALKANFSNAGEFVPPEVDEEGYSKFQAWCLIEKLGHMIGWGGDQPFDLNILFEVEE